MFTPNSKRKSKLAGWRLVGAQYKICVDSTEGEKSLEGDLGRQACDGVTLESFGVEGTGLVERWSASKE